MREYNYWIVDSFSRMPYLGNPAAIVFDADELTDERMQTIARYLNLSETVFLCEPRAANADYRARIFTPREEIPFAGHPTVASAFAHYSRMPTIAQRSITRLGQECGIGTVTVEVEVMGGAPFFKLRAGPASARGADVTPQIAARMLGCDAGDLCDLPIEVCSGGLPWLIVKLRCMDAIKKLTPDQSLIDEVCRKRLATGITVYCDGAELENVDHHVRTFAPGVGITEDPACGSGNIALAIHRAHHSDPNAEALTFTCEQGLEVHREAVLHLYVTRSQSKELVIQLGGHAVRAMEGGLLG